VPPATPDHHVPRTVPGRGREAPGHGRRVAARQPRGRRPAPPAPARQYLRRLRLSHPAGRRPSHLGRHSSMYPASTRNGAPDGWAKTRGLPVGAQVSAQPSVAAVEPFAGHRIDTNGGHRATSALERQPQSQHVTGQRHAPPSTKRLPRHRGQRSGRSRGRGVPGRDMGGPFGGRTMGGSSARPGCHTAQWVYAGR
jgi:hypothetical protein